MRAVLGAILVTMMVGGCAQLRPVKAPAAGGADATLDFMVRLVEADGPELERIGGSFDPPIDAASAPRPALRHALWQGTPGHPGYDPDAARARLQALLERPQALSGSERDLVRLQVAHLDRRLRLHRANADLTEANRELREQIEALTDLESEMGENEANGE